MSTFWWLLEVVAIIKTSRWIWQNKDCALLGKLFFSQKEYQNRRTIIRIFHCTIKIIFHHISEFAMLHIVILSFGSYLPINFTRASRSNETSFSQTTNFYCTRPILLLVLSIFRDRLRQMIEKLYFMASLTISSMEDRTSRRSYSGVLCQVFDLKNLNDSYLI